ncbi:MAG: hypothetical protein MJ252_16950 [archaeon]|nr:hypothetical protein [archaeon]
MIRLQINEFGQVPKQIFKKPHPQKYSFKIKELSTNDLLIPKKEEKNETENKTILENNENESNLLKDDNIEDTNINIEEKTEEEIKKEEIKEEEIVPIIEDSNINTEDDPNDVKSYFSRGFLSNLKQTELNSYNFGQYTQDYGLLKSIQKCPYTHKR